MKPAFQPPAVQELLASHLEHELRDDTAGFTALADLLRAKTGVHLTLNAKNRTLMATRLGPILRRRGLAGYQAYLAALRQEGERALAELTSAMTTHTTDFFREKRHFELLAQILREAYRTRVFAKGDFRIWCAAASTGQEPYTLAMVALDTLPDVAAHSVKILATDIDRKVLEEAARGLYTEGDLRGMPPIYLQRFFQSRPSPRGKLWSAGPELRGMIRFAPLNLLSTPYPFRHGFDVIFCRNVFIYFERATILSIVARMRQALRPDGHLFVGHSESGIIKEPGLVSIETGAYRLKPTVA